MKIEKKKLDRRKFSPREFHSYRVSDRGEPFRGKNQIVTRLYPDGTKYCRLEVYGGPRRDDVDLEFLVTYLWHGDPTKRYHVPVPVNNDPDDMRPDNWRWGHVSEHPRYRLDYIGRVLMMPDHLRHPYGIVRLRRRPPLPDSNYSGAYGVNITHWRRREAEATVAA